jgi:3-hydroxyisobutyrate dehydrogenase-like beta-hydroxyacid dehydrogenase
MNARIGLIGAGLMGHGIGKNIVEKGFPLAVLGHRNRAPVEDLVSRGAVEATDIPDLVSRSDIVIVCVTGSPQVEDLVQRDRGLLAASREGLLVVDTSTSEPDSTLRLAALLAARGVMLVDAPLTRTPVEAEAGRLNTIVGADRAVFERLRPVFAAYCENIFHAGPLASGHRLKLINNFLVTGTVALVAEAVVTARRTGIDLLKLYDVINSGPMANVLMRNLIPKAAAGEFDGMRFQLSNAQKDLRYYSHLVEGVGLPSFMGQTVHQIFTQAVASGFGDRLMPSLIQAQAKLAGESL